MQVEGQHGTSVLMATGARVSNAYQTCLILGNSLAKVRLMPDVFRVSHEVLNKDLSVWDGDA